MLDITILGLNGVRQIEAPVETMEAWGMIEPDGVYDVTRTYQAGGVLLLEEHLNRLDNSARSEGIPVVYPRQRARAVVRARLDEKGLGSSRLRFCIGRDKPEELIITLEEIGAGAQQLAGLKANGVHADLRTIARRNPAAKTNDWVRERNRLLAQEPTDCYESLIVSGDGELLEGFSSNFYAIRAGKMHAAEEGRVLSGLARRVVFIVARSICTVVESAIRVDEIESLDEAFLTSSGRGIVPITRIGEVILGDGKPGPLTIQLMNAYDDWVVEHIEAL